MRLEFLSTVSYSVRAHSDAPYDLEIETNRVRRWRWRWSQRGTHEPPDAAASSRTARWACRQLWSVFYPDSRPTTCACLVRSPKLLFVVHHALMKSCIKLARVSFPYAAFLIPINMVFTPLGLLKGSIVKLYETFVRTSHTTVAQKLSFFFLMALFTLMWLRHIVSVGLHWHFLVDDVQPIAA